MEMAAKALTTPLSEKMGGLLFFYEYIGYKPYFQWVARTQAVPITQTTGWVYSSMMRLR